MARSTPIPYVLLHVRPVELCHRGLIVLLTPIRPVPFKLLSFLQIKLPLVKLSINSTIANYDKASYSILEQS